MSTGRTAPGAGPRRSVVEFAVRASKEFIIEPRLEPGLPQLTLAELKAANIQLLYVLPNETNATFYILGLDGKLRALP